MDNLNKYKMFYEVAKEGNITRAAEKLYISQPAISQTIKDLEEELGVALFIRNKKGVELTRVGCEIFARVEGAMLSFKSIDQMINEQNDLSNGKIIIGAGSNISRDLLAGPLTEFLMEFPNIKIELVEEPQDVMFKILKEGKVDLVITQKNDDIDGFSFCPLKDYPYVFVRSKVGRTDKFITMAKGTYTHKLFVETMKKLGKSTAPDIMVAGYNMAVELARLGAGVALVPKFVAQKCIDSGELVEHPENYKLPTITFGYYFNDYLLNPATKVFLKFLDKQK